jgi:hypothetical protein
VSRATSSQNVINRTRSPDSAPFLERAAALNADYYHLHAIRGEIAQQRAAALYSLIGTAKLNGLDPALYLRTVLAKLPEHPINQIQQLLPWNLALSLQNDPSKAA